jgi:parvulin-like peptidyl-prolyl isomerase
MSPKVRAQDQRKQAVEQHEAESAEARKEARGVRGNFPARTWWGAVAVVLLAVAALGVWLWTSGSWKGWQAVAKVDGSRITRAELEEHLAFMANQGRIRPDVLTDASRRMDAERFALGDLIAWRLVLAEAERLNVVVEPGEEDMVFGKAHGAQFGESMLVETAKKTGEDVARLRLQVRRQLLMVRLRDKIAEDVSVSDDEVANYYESHRQAFVTPELAHLRLLLVGSREEAERLRNQALRGAEFATLAREHSMGGAQERGGDIGWVDLRMLPAAIATAVAPIPHTGITPVVEAKGGFYVVRVEGRQTPRQIPLAEVKGQIKERLTADRKQAKFAEWLEGLRRSARVQVYL